MQQDTATRAQDALRCGKDSSEQSGNLTSNLGVGVRIPPSAPASSGASMSSAAEISMCTQQDYNQILDELQEFWCFPTMPAAARHAWFFGNRSRRTSSPASADRLHVAWPRSRWIRSGPVPAYGRNPPTAARHLRRATQ